MVKLDSESLAEGILDAVRSALSDLQEQNAAKVWEVLGAENPLDDPAGAMRTMQQHLDAMQSQLSRSADSLMAEIDEAHKRLGI